MLRPTPARLNKVIKIDNTTHTNSIYKTTQEADLQHFEKSPDKLNQEQNQQTQSQQTQNMTQS